MANDTMIHSDIFIHDRIIRSFCRVRWSKPSRGGAGYECGMNFVIFNEPDMDFIGETVEKYGRSG